MENTNLVNRLKQLTKRKQQRSHARSALASISNGTKMPSTMRIFCEKETLPISTGSLATCVSSDTIKIDEFLKEHKSFISFTIHDSVIVDISKDETHLARKLVSIFGDTELGHFLVNSSVGSDFGNMRGTNK